MDQSNVAAVRNHLNAVAQQYSTYDDYDYWLNLAACKIILPKVEAKRVLQMGCASGVITEELLQVVSELHIVEGSSSYVEQIRSRFGTKTLVVEALFEEFETDELYEAIVLDNTLHILNQPEQILSKIRRWLTPNGMLHITVPNNLSLHRRLGLKMGLIDKTEDKSERGTLFQHQFSFNQESLRSLLEKQLFEIDECFNYLLKPFSNAQMQNIGMNNELFRGLFDLGQDFPDIANQIYLSARRA